MWWRANTETDTPALRCIPFFAKAQAEVALLKYFEELLD